MDNTVEYHFKLDGQTVWFGHIVMGIILTYIGKQLLDKKEVDQNSSLLLIIMGVLGILYHGHIWYTHYDDE